MKRLMVRRWRSASFTARFSLVLLILAACVTAVPLAIVAQQSRNVALAHVVDEAQLMGALVGDQQTALQTYAAGVAGQVGNAGLLTVPQWQEAINRDSASAAPGDIVALTGPHVLAASGGQPLDTTSPAVAQLLADVAAGHHVADHAGAVWLIGTAPAPDGVTVVAARRLRADLVPGMAVVANGVLVQPGTVADAHVSAGTGIDPAMAQLVSADGNGIVRVGGADTAVAGVSLGNGYSGVISAQTTGVTAVDTTALILGAISLIAVLLTVVVVQSDLYQPLRRLSRAAAALADDDFTVPIPDDLGDDVIGRLAGTVEATRRRLRGTLAASRARAAIASELNTPQPLRGALMHVGTALREACQARAVLIVVGESELGDPFIVQSGEAAVTATFAELASGTTPIAKALTMPGLHAAEIEPTPELPCHRVAAVAVTMGLAVRGAVVVCDPDPARQRDADEILTTTAEQVALALERYRILTIVERQASIDDLTGIHNHRFLVDYLGQQIAVAERQGAQLSVLMLDIDHFKSLNDTHGHHAGDVALQRFAQTVTASIRRSDLVARYGGEEFVVVMPNTSAEEAMPVAEKIRAAVAGLDVEVDPGGPHLRFTVSMGVATFPENTLSGRDLINLADEALYRAKGGGRNRVERCTKVAMAAMTVRSARPAALRKEKEPSP